MVKSNLAYKAQDTVVPEVVVNESPIKWCAVALSDVIARGKRLEASVFDVEAKQARSLIAKGKYTQSFIGGASGMASSYVCGRFKRIWVEKSDIIEHLKRYAEEVTTVGDPRISREVILPGRFKRVYVDEGYGRVLIGGKQLSELDPSSKKYLSTAKHDKMLKKLEVHEGTTLITRSGTIGKITIVPKHWEHYIPSDHIIRVIPANKDIAGYLNIFLASDYGKVLITRFTYGSVVDEIDDNHVRQIAIPLLKNHTVQKKINDLALEANEKRYQAYLLEQEALQIMDRDVIYAKK